MAEEQLVLFRLGNEEYGISIAQVKEIIRYNGATRLPNTPVHMEGIITLRGKIIPVVDLASRLSLTKQKTGDMQTVIVETTGREIGLVVDEVTEVTRLPDRAIDPSPVASANGYIKGIGKDGDRLLILLDVDKLFNEDELKKTG